MAGFLGFLPFALECHEMYWVARKVLDRTKRRPVLRWALWLCIATFIVATFWGIDHFTVRTFQQ
jgi:quinol-cytochrome oxidoreductase complex cytochrome b subunit